MKLSWPRTGDARRSMVLRSRGTPVQSQQRDLNNVYILNIGYSSFAGQHDALESIDLGVVCQPGQLPGWYQSVKYMPQGLSWLPSDEGVFEEELVLYCEPVLSA